MNFEENDRKYIDIIESIITRMSDNSKQMKEWCIALVTGLVGVSFTIKVGWLCVVALPVVAIFRHLDAFYLQLERCFRCLYDEFIKAIKDGKQSKKEKMLYRTSIKKYTRKMTLEKVKESTSIKSFYSGMFWGVAVLAVISLIVNIYDEEKIKLTNESLNLNISTPLNVRMEHLDSLKIDINKIDSLIVKIDELKRMSVQVVDTVKTKSLIRKR